MDYTIFYVIVAGLAGLVSGSFVGAAVWRLRARQLLADKKNGEKVLKKDARQVERLPIKSVKADRSVCLYCGHQLQWYDLVPIVSWVSLGGKCRYCKAKIGWTEPALEIGMAVFFVASYAFWPYLLDSSFALLHFAIWLVAGVGLATLFVYDMRWYLLPNRVVFPLIGLGLLNTFVVLADRQFALAEIANVLYSCAMLSGLYYFIYVISKHQWVGFGDVKLGLVLALLLVDFRLSVLALFLANLVGTIVYLPLIVRGRIKGQTRIPFGPLLITGWFISGLFGANIIAWYMTITLGTI